MRAFGKIPRSQKHSRSSSSAYVFSHSESATAWLVANRSFPGHFQNMWRASHGECLQRKHAAEEPNSAARLAAGQKPPTSKHSIVPAADASLCRTFLRRASVFTEGPLSRPLPQKCLAAFVHRVDSTVALTALTVCRSVNCMGLQSQRWGVSIPVVRSDPIHSLSEWQLAHTKGQSSVASEPPRLVAHVL